mgnify:CR=1 FL=1
MYDTRTVENPQEWDFDPWGGEIKDYAGHRKVLTGRGSMGAKGPYVAFLNSLESIIAVEGKLPFNIIFLAEGDEILGSPSYKMFVKKYNEYLKKADFSFCPTISEGSNEEVSIGMGLKGMIVFDLKIWLKDELVLIEKDFRDLVNNHDWNNYKDHLVLIQCSNNAIIPHWAYL